MKRTLQLTLLLAAIVLVMEQCNVIWLPPKIYQPNELVKLHPPVMTLEEYTSSGFIDKHARPLIYTVENKNTNGAVLIFGAEHSKDPNHKQVPVMEEEWKKFKPTVAMLEGRLGFLFTWTHNAIEAKGESGLTAKMAKKTRGVKLYTWEPGREAEIADQLNRNMDAAHLIAFYALQSQQNRWAGFPKIEQDKIMNEIIAKRVKKYKDLQGSITGVEHVDSIWKADYPDLPSWRSYKHPRNGWPDGKFKQIAESTNDLRNAHICRSIIELVNKGERVFISMGSSHAAVIERTLRGMIH